MKFTIPQGDLIAALRKSRVCTGRYQPITLCVLREVRASSRLLMVDGDDVLINGYPLHKEKSVQQARGVGKAGAMARWKKEHGENMPPGMPPAIETPLPPANAEGKWKGREGVAAKPLRRLRLPSFRMIWPGWMDSQSSSAHFLSIERSSSDQ